MKRSFKVKLLSSAVITAMILTLSSCGLLSDKASGKSDDYYETNKSETTQSTLKTETLDGGVENENPGDNTENGTPNDNTNDDTESSDDTNDNENEPQVSNTVTITTTANDTDNYGLAGSYTILKSKQYRVGDKAKLTATVNEGYNFEGWYVVEKTGSGYYEQTKLVLLSTDTSYTYTVQDKNVTIAAIFSYYTVTTASSTNTGGAAGSFTRLNEKKVSNGEAVELTATVNDGYNFEGWYIDGICVSKDLTYTYTMEKENISIEVKYSCYQFSTIGYAKSASGETEAGFNAGTYTKYSSENLSAGETVTLKATVNDGYNFVGWHINGVCVSTDLEYTYTMEKASVTIEAVYSYYTVYTWATGTTDSWNYNDHGCRFEETSICMTTIYNHDKISAGKSITLIANDVEGYTFYGWRTWSAFLSYDKEYTFTMPAENMEIFAVYSEN